MTYQQKIEEFIAKDVEQANKALVQNRTESFSRIN
jgi:hypothetical protein